MLHGPKPSVKRALYSNRALFSCGDACSNRWRASSKAALQLCQECVKQCSSKCWASRVQHVAVVIELQIMWVPMLTQNQSTFNLSTHDERPGHGRGQIPCILGLCFFRQRMRPHNIIKKGYTHNKTRNYCTCARRDQRGFNSRQISRTA